MKIGIIVAMDKEFVQLKTLLDEQTAEQHNGCHFVLGSIGPNDIVMTQCGIGKVNAAIGAVELINAYRPDLVVSTGVAGGADPSLQVMDVVASTECAYHDAYCGTQVAYGQLQGLPPTFHTPPHLVEKALSLNDGGATGQRTVQPLVKAGLTVTGDWFVDSREKMSEILNHFPQAQAVDMESCAIAHTCYVRNTAFISFRIISDVPLRDQKASQYFDFWARMADGSFNVTRRFLQTL